MPCGMPLRADQIRKQKAAKYRREAEHFRQMAGAAPSEPIADQLLGIATEYDQLAERLEATLKL
jgi:hypothetical protein